MHHYAIFVVINKVSFINKNLFLLTRNPNSKFSGNVRCGSSRKGFLVSFKDILGTWIQGSPLFFLNLPRSRGIYLKQISNQSIIIRFWQGTSNLVRSFRLSTSGLVGKWLYDHYLKLKNKCQLVPGWVTATV